MAGRSTYVYGIARLVRVVPREVFVMEQMSRWDFLGRSVAAMAGAAVFGLAGSGQADPGPEAGKLVPPGQQEVMPLPYAYDALKGLSQQVVTWHHDTHYAGYVKNRNAIEKALAAMDPQSATFNAGTFAGLKKQETFNTCGQILHEVYFSNLGGDGQADPNLKVAAALQRDFGSLAAWQADLRATAMGAGIGWGVTCWDPSSGRLINFLVELHQMGAIWAAVPIVALDGWEHAFYHDYGPSKNKYFDVFFQNLHWGRIDARFTAASG